MRIVLIGARGQLGTDLLPRLQERHDVVPLGHMDIELTDASAAERVLGNAEPDFVINAAAYNFVDQAEDEPDVAFAVNGLGPRNLALFCGGRDIPLLHISSDHVFGQDADRTTPYLETDCPGPVSAYAVSKLAGEYFVRGLCQRHFVVRTCGLYGHAALDGGGKGNFVETMFRLGTEKDSLRIVDDQCCTPTATSDLARAIALLIETQSYGLYHATNGGSTTWCGLAREIFRIADIDVAVTPITSEEFDAKARRPHYSVLDTTRLTTTIEAEFPDWQAALKTYIDGRSTATADHESDSP